VQLVEAEGVPTKIEPTGKIFPASDKAADVLAAFLRRLERSGASLALGEPVLDLYSADGGFQLDMPSRTITTGTVVVTTGGQSYPGCGTTGDGYGWLQRLGHTIVPPRPALTPITTHADWAKSLRGVTLEDVVVRVVEDGGGQASPGPGVSKRRGSPRGLLAERRGGLLFAHFGLTGPAVLDVSRFITLHPRPRSLQLVCDFLPKTTSQSLADELQRFAAAQGKKQIAVLLADRLPRRLADALAQQAGVSAGRRAAELSREERTALVQAVKEMRIPVTGTLGFEKAEVTVGGVALDEVDSRCMQSKLVPRLFMAGEILDLDGPIGGYNFQAAFSTGWLAGEAGAAT